MTIDLRVRGIDLTDELRQAVERCVGFAVSRYNSQIDKISVGLADTNGPKGGDDKLCRIAANLSRGERVLILATGGEILSTVNRAARRLDHRIGTMVQRRNRPNLHTFRESIRAA